MKSIVGAISRSAAVLLTHPSCLAWFKSQTLTENDVVLVNNSFVYRDVNTVKSDKYLVFRISSNGEPEKEPYIATWTRINLDFKLIKHNSSNLPNLLSLESEVNKEIKALGPLIFLLIGRVEDNVSLEQVLNHSSFDAVVWDPTLTDIARIDGSRILVRDTYDEETVFAHVASFFQDRGEQVPSGLRESFGVALDALQDQAVANLAIPIDTLPKGNSMTDDIVEVLLEQKSNYEKALERCDGEPSKDPAAYNEILRISYNFASDASTFLRLIVSICDLKPIVLWGTISQHYRLSEAFRDLPWIRSRYKPSLKNYISTVADARNSAFHDLFPFRKSLNVLLPDTALQKVSLRFFSEHSRKRDNQLIYQDKELVDVLLAFTRARDRRAPSRFWHKNAQVMDALIELFKSTGEFLKVLHSA
jgi:hypothetical protein